MHMFFFLKIALWGHIKLNHLSSTLHNISRTRHVIKEHIVASVACSAVICDCCGTAGFLRHLPRATGFVLTFTADILRWTRGSV